jgi:hypothetical protein
MKRRTSRIRIAVVLITLAAMASVSAGCMWTPELSQVCRDIERQLPGASFDKEFAVSLGPISLGFARLLTGLVPEARQARGYLGDVSRIQVAVYDASHVSSIGEVRMPRRLTRLTEEGWETAVRAREDDSVIWVMYRIEDDSIREMYVIVLDDTELVMVKARGHLERLAARALREAHDTPGVPHIDDEVGDLRSSLN